MSSSGVYSCRYRARSRHWEKECRSARKRLRLNPEEDEARQVLQRKHIPQEQEGLLEMLDGQMRCLRNKSKRCRWGCLYREM